MIVYETDETYIEHHGVKGQRWGVRRAKKKALKADKIKKGEDFIKAKKKEYGTSNSEQLAIAYGKRKANQKLSGPDKVALTFTGSILAIYGAGLASAYYNMYKNQGA